MDIGIILSHKIPALNHTCSHEKSVRTQSEALVSLQEAARPGAVAAVDMCHSRGAGATVGWEHRHRQHVAMDTSTGQYTLSSIYAIYAADIYTVSRVITAPIASTIAINITSIRIDRTQMMFAILTSHGATLPAPVVVAECCKLRCRLMMLVHIFLTIPCPSSPRSET